MNRLYKMRSLGYAEAGDDIWFPNLYFNGLIRLKKSTGRIEIVGKFPHYGINQEWLYSTVCYVNGYLVAIPNNSEEIAAYHIETGEFTVTPLDLEWVGKKRTYFVAAYVYGAFVYLLPLGAACIVRYDVAEHSVKYLDNCIGDLLRALPETSYGLYQQFEWIEEKIYMPFLDINAVAIFDPRDESAEIRYLDIQGGCSTISYIDGFFYLASWNRPEVYRWNPKDGEILTYSGLLEDGVGGKAFLYAGIVGESLLLFPEKGEQILSLSVKTGEVKRLRQICNLDKEVKNTFFVQEIGGRSCVLTSDVEKPHFFSYEEGRLEMKPVCRLDHAYNQRQISDFLIQEGYYGLCPETEKSFESFLEIVAGAGEAARTQTPQTFCGEEIFWQIKKRR